MSWKKFAKQEAALRMRRENLHRMEAELMAERESRLAELPARFGFADLASFVRALRAAARKSTTGKGARLDLNPPASRTRRRRKAKESKAQVPGEGAAGLARLSPTLPQMAKETGAAPLQAANAWPSGDSLEDPKNFGVKPDRGVLERGALSAEAHRGKLAEALRFATRVLHTSKVPAPVWREWRSFERELHAALQKTVVGA